LSTTIFVVGIASFFCFPFDNRFLLDADQVTVLFLNDNTALFGAVFFSGLAL
jgi:hypothetical protein